MNVLQRFICVLFLFSLILPGFALAEPASRQIDVQPLFDKGGLEPGKQADVHVLITIVAPPSPEIAKRKPVAVSLVVDRSGSMSADRKIDYAVKAGKVLVNALGKDDLVSITVYDSQVKVLYPLSPVTNKDRLLSIIDGIRPGGSTFLSGGLEEGIKQMEKARGEFPCRVILLSDGQANQGVISPEGVAAIGAQSRNKGINVSTVGLGLSFNEDLMQSLAQRGGGQYYYIEDSEDLPGVFRQELALVQRAFTKNLRTVYRKPDFVHDISAYGYTTSSSGKDVQIDLGDLSAGEKRQIMLRLKLTGPAETGEISLGNIQFAYTDPESGESRETVVPMLVNVVADEQARKDLEDKNAGKIRQVKDEVLLLQAESARMQASQELSKGNLSEARKLLKQSESELAGSASDNVVIKNKLEQIQHEESSLETVMRQPSAMKDYAKQSKVSAYKSAQGKTAGLVLGMGDSGYLVERLQRALVKAGFWNKEPDGVFNSELEQAVKAFQKSKSLTPDGVVGESTRRALGI